VTTAPRPGRRTVGLLTAGLLGAAALAGCGSEVEGTASPAESAAPTSSSSAPATETAPATPEDLSAGLLPADAFGPGAQVTPITGDELLAQQDLLGGGLGGLQDVTITPESCAPALKGVQPGLEDLTGLAAQTATSGSSAVVQLLAAGDAVAGSVEQLRQGLTDCPEAQITAPEIGTATVTFAPLEVPDLGDGSAALTMTLSLTGPDGAPLSVPVQVGAVMDGDRLVNLTATTVDPTGPGAAVDPAAFAQLLQRAYEHQHDALD
jgi:hypothetical protein